MAYRGGYYNSTTGYIAETLEEYHWRMLKQKQWFFNLNPENYRRRKAYAKKLRQEQKVLRAHMKRQYKRRTDTTYPKDEVARARECASIAVDAMLGWVSKYTMRDVHLAVIQEARGLIKLAKEHQPLP